MQHPGGPQRTDGKGRHASLCISLAEPVPAHTVTPAALQPKHTDQLRCCICRWLGTPWAVRLRTRLGHPLAVACLMLCVPACLDSTRGHSCAGLLVAGERLLPAASMRKGADAWKGGGAPFPAICLHWPRSDSGSLRVAQTA